MLRNQRAYQFIYDWTKNRCAAAVGAWGGRMVGRAAVGLLGCLKKEQMSENALLQAAEAAKKCYLRPAADTDDWQALQPFGQTEVLVSVIVPVHNGEKDLKQCLNSILAQECGSTVEIIAVNDNSTDSSGDILEEYANWGEVRRVELTKETGGSAAKARNAGILQAKGEYLLFVDCDDVLLPGAISALLQKAQQTAARPPHGRLARPPRTGGRTLRCERQSCLRGHHRQRGTPHRGADQRLPALRARPAPRGVLRHDERHGAGRPVRQPLLHEHPPRHG